MTKAEKREMMEQMKKANNIEAHNISVYYNLKKGSK